MSVIDFSPDERATLCEPNAEEALRKSGIFLEDLRPRPLESFEEPTRDLRAQAYEQRRQYQWRLLREELGRLNKKETAPTKQGPSSSASWNAKPTVAPASVARLNVAKDSAGVSAAAEKAHEVALRQMVTRETRALERELRAEAQRQRLEWRQQKADEARAEAAAEKERRRAAQRESREFLSDVRAARRDLEAEPRRQPAASARPSSAPPSGRLNSARASASAASTGALAEEVRARAASQQAQRALQIAEKQKEKDEAFARRQNAVANERALRKLQAEQARLRHEERFSGVQLQALERQVRNQQELDDKQHRAERERAAMRAAVGKVVVDGQEMSEAAAADAERASKVALRAAQAQERLEEQRRKQATEYDQREARAEATRKAQMEQAERDRRMAAVRSHEKEMRRASMLAAKKAADEVQRSRIESAQEVATRRSLDAKAKQQSERERKKLEQEVKLETHRENAERVRRATEHRMAMTEAAIEQKSLKYEQRLKTAEESRQLRQAYAVQRAKQEANMASKLRASADKGALVSAVAAGESIDLHVPMTSAWDHPLPAAPRASSSSSHPRASASTSSSAAAAALPAAADESSAAAPLPPSVARGFGGSSGAKENSDANSYGRRPAPAPSADDRAASKQKAAFARIEKVRIEQNAELRAAVEAEQTAEAGRVQLLAACAEGADRVRLQKLLKLERERADAELMGLTAEHELRLAQEFKRLGMTR